MRIRYRTSTPAGPPLLIRRAGLPAALDLAEVPGLDRVEPVLDLLLVLGESLAELLLLRDLDVLGLDHDLLIHEDGGPHAQRERDRVRRARVHRDLR